VHGTGLGLRVSPLLNPNQTRTNRPLCLPSVSHTSTAGGLSRRSIRREAKILCFSFFLPQPDREAIGASSEAAGAFLFSRLAFTGNPRVLSECSCRFLLLRQGSRLDQRQLSSNCKGVKPYQRAGGIALPLGDAVNPSKLSIAPIKSTVLCTKTPSGRDHPHQSQIRHHSSIRNLAPSDRPNTSGKYIS
jgi:hypothetical protein